MMFDIKYILIYITILGMEVSWLYAVLNAANKSVADRLSIPLLLLTLLISFGVSKGLSYLKWPKPALTTLSWVADRDAADDKDTAFSGPQAERRHLAGFYTRGLLSNILFI